jgi:hypothetical protein
MKKVFFIILVVFLGFELDAQVFKFVSAKNSEYCPFRDSSSYCTNLKLIFLDNNIPLLVNIGAEADLKAQKQELWNVIGFSSKLYSFGADSDLKLPYVKIRNQKGSFWVSAKYPYIFSISHPVLQVKSQGVEFDFYFAMNIANINVAGADVLKLLVMENKQTQKFYLINMDNSAGTNSSIFLRNKNALNYFYILSNKETIRGFDVEKHMIMLHIRAKGIKYSLVIFPRGETYYGKYYSVCITKKF